MPVDLMLEHGSPNNGAAFFFEMVGGPSRVLNRRYALRRYMRSSAESRSWSSSAMVMSGARVGCCSLE